MRAAEAAGPGPASNLNGKFTPQELRQREQWRTRRKAGLARKEQARTLLRFPFSFHSPLASHLPVHHDDNRLLTKKYKAPLANEGINCPCKYSSLLSQCGTLESSNFAMQNHFVEPQTLWRGREEAVQQTCTIPCQTGPHDSFFEGRLRCRELSWFDLPKTSRRTPVRLSTAYT